MELKSWSPVSIYKVKRAGKVAKMLWNSGLEKLGQQWNQVWSAVEFYDAFAGPDGTKMALYDI